MIVQLKTSHYKHDTCSCVTCVIVQPRKVVVEQLSRVLPSEDCVPDQLILVNTGDPLGALLAAKLTDRQHKVICTASSADVRATVSALVNKIQKL